MRSKKVVKLMKDAEVITDQATPTEGTPSRPTTVEAYAIPKELREALLVYLGAKPLNESENTAVALVVALRDAQLVTLNVVYNDRP